MHPVQIEKLLRADTEAEIVEVVREYLSTWHPEELRDIPECCRPGKIRDAEDIGDCAYELTRARIASSGPETLLVEMETFFAHASTRLSKLDNALVHPDAESTSSDAQP